VIWSDSGNLVLLALKDSFFIMRYNAQLVQQVVFARRGSGRERRGLAATTQGASYLIERPNTCEGGGGEGGGIGGR